MCHSQNWSRHLYKQELVLFDQQCLLLLKRMFSCHLYFLSGSQRNKDKNERRPLDLKHPANNNKDDADEDQLRSAETEVTQSENTPEPVVVLSGWNMTLSKLDSQ